MKKLFAVIISVAMILSMSALFTSALEVVGDINITWDAEASSKLNLNDGDISDWSAAGYEYITLTPDSFHAWSGTIPETFAINCYFVSDADNLYVAFWINDEDFTPDADGYDPSRTDYRENGYWGDAFQISIDYNTVISRWCDEEDYDFGNNKAVFYSFASYGEGTPITIVRQETYNNDGYLSEENGDPVKGSTNKYEGGWCAEFALSWEMLYQDSLEKTDSIEPESTWDATNDLTVGITLCYIDHNEAGQKWAAGTFDNENPGWLATDSGIRLQLAYEDGRTINCSGIEYPGKDAAPETTAPETTVAPETTAPETTAPETTAAETTAAETTAAATTAAATTAAPAAETTAAPAAVTTAAPATTTAAASEGGCGSVVGAGAAVVVLSAIVAGAALSKKRD